jgi:hypothetical protein
MDRETRTLHNVDRAYGLTTRRWSGARRCGRSSLRELDGCERQRRAGPVGERRPARQSFGIGGVSLSDAGSRPIAGDLVVRSDGRVIVAGSLHTGGARQLALLRFQGDAASAPWPAQGYVVDGYGATFGFSAACAAKPPRPTGSPYWGGWDIVRGIAVLPGGRALVVDGFAECTASGSATGRWRLAGLGQRHVAEHGHGAWRGRRARRYRRLLSWTAPVICTCSLRPTPPCRRSRPGCRSWPGQDFARGRAAAQRGGRVRARRGGGLHPFGGAPGCGAGVPSWPGQDVARGVTICTKKWRVVVDVWRNARARDRWQTPSRRPRAGGPYWRRRVKIARVASRSCKSESSEPHGRAI